MTSILLIKTSSMGDVIHSLPIVSDIHRYCSGARIDWVIEEGYAPIPALHPHVGEVIPVALRRWRKTFWNSSVARELRDLRDRLRRHPYDAVLDAQGLLKSCLLCRMALGPKYGFDWTSARESLAALCYDKRFWVPWSLHAVERNRSLAAQAFGYRAGTEIDYGIAARGRPLAWLPDGPYCVLLHATSRKDKEWLHSRWIELGRGLAERGWTVIVPGGSLRERQHARRLAAEIPRALAPDAIALGEVAAMLARARVVVGVDTGLTHLAAALSVPVVALYCGSDPRIYGVYGSSQSLNLGAPGRAPQVEEVLSAVCRLAGQR